MDDNGSAWSHDPAARLGPASDVPDGLERLGPTPAPDTTPVTNGGTVAVRTPQANAQSGVNATLSVQGPEAEADDADHVDDLDDADDADHLDDLDDADDNDPPPRWAGGRTPSPRTLDDPAADAEASAARRPARAAGSHSTYWAAAVLIVFATIAGVGLMRRGDSNDPAPSDDRSPSSDTTGDAAGAGEGGPTASTATTAAAASTTVPEAAATPGSTAAGDVTRAPVVGECAAAVEGTPWQYVYRACDDERATVRLTQTLPSPAPADSSCPEGTDTVAQVTQDAGSAAGDGALWCLRNLSPPHPGDPGGGGGQLVVGDCLGTATSGRSVEVPCEGGDPSPEYRVGWMPDAAGACPAESVAAIDLQVPFPARFCLEYV